MGVLLGRTAVVCVRIGGASLFVDVLEEEVDDEDGGGVPESEHLGAKEVAWTAAAVADVSTTCAEDFGFGAPFGRKGRKPLLLNLLGRYPNIEPNWLRRKRNYRWNHTVCSPCED